MYPRLVLLKQFLSEDGAIFVSIDDNEVASLRLLMDEVFGKKNFVLFANCGWSIFPGLRLQAARRMHSGGGIQGGRSLERG